MRARSLALALLLSAAAPLLAQEHPNLAKGFAADKAYSMGDVDSVNLFNGNLTLSIPIGQSYPVGGNLSYRIAAYYNSNLWRYSTNSNFQWNGIVDEVTVVDPSNEFNAGLGWSLHFGRLYQPNTASYNDTGKWVYLSPDGARHSFYSRLHSDITAEAGSGILYSRDGSYLRLNTSASPKTIEFPDGTIHEFAQNGTQGQLGWNATKIRDRFGNWVSFAYTSNLKWTIADSVGRQQVVNFTDHGTAINGNRYNVSSVVLAAFGGTATWSFSYDKAVQIDRTDKDLWWGNNSPIGDEFGPDPVTVSLLKTVAGPAGLTWSISENGTAAYDRGDPAAIHDQYSGLIQSLQVPTKASLRWTWQRWVFPNPTGGRMSWRTRSVGVATRTMDDPIRSMVPVWTYATAIAYAGTSPEVQTTVTDPLGNISKSYFTARPGNENTQTWYWDYSLPFTCRVTSGGKCLSRELTAAGGSGRSRSWWVSYAHDTVPSQPVEDQDLINTNRRVSNERTFFDDDTGYLDHSYSDFDGYGHYRSDQNEGSFGTVATRTLQTHYNPATGCYPGCGGFNPILPGAAWVLGTYDFTQQSENGAVDRHEYSFNTANGSLTCERALKSGSTRSSADVVVTYLYDATGNRTSESWFGADKVPLGTGSTCSGAPTYSYKLAHTYSAGVRATSKYLKPSGADVGFSILSTTIHANTGLVTSSYDTAGFRTTYDYDLLGRLIETDAIGDGADSTDNGARTTYVWTFGTVGGNTNKVVVTRNCPSGLSGCTATNFGESHYEYDGFGRLNYEKTRRADGSLVKRRTRINGLGWKVNVSEWLPDGSSAYMFTSFSGYDVYGRPDTITPPEGSSHAILMTYHGDRSVSRAVKVATALDGTEVTKTTTETYDVFGRLVEVHEPAPGVTASYDYDEGNRLKHVDLFDGTVHQHRYFGYDGLGFLRSETHPEKGAAGNGSVTYGDYDAKGHAGYRYDTTAARGVEFAYDSAERLTAVNETSAAGGRPLKSFTFDSATGYGNGKLATATGWTYSPAAGTYPDVRVTESYTYSGRGGAISAKSTQVNENGLDTERYDQTFTWSPGGELVSQSYPRCFNGACGAGGQAASSYPSTYAYGYLTAVSWAIPAVTYHDSGMVASVSHDNGIEDTYEEDAYGRARPTRIKSNLGATPVFDTGVYTYDGSGNIEGIGNSHFRYDGVSRLAEAELNLWFGTSRQSYGMDSFGNIQSITTTPVGGSATIRNTPTSLATNRLSTGVYDAGGNLTSLYGNTYTYDVLNRMVRNQSGAEDWFFAYTADDERIEMIRNGGGGRIATLRGLDAQVVRETHLEQSGTPYADYVRWGGKLGAKKESTGEVTHYHLDHLGTPRIFTDATGAVTAGADYYPYGEEIVPQESTERMRFTGHERDVLSTTAGSNFTADDLDYMHARHESPLVGRFLSIDTDGLVPLRPQSWNRYAYVVDNPTNFSDPSGRCAADLCVGEIYVASVVSTAIVSVATSWLASPNGEDPKRTNAEVLADGMKKVGGAIATMFESKTKTGSANGETSGKRMPQAVQDQAGKEATDDDGQTHCQNCGAPTSKPGQEPEAGQLKGNTDHIVPASKGGNATLDNAQHTCETCNKSAGNRRRPKTTGAQKLQIPSITHR